MKCVVCTSEKEYIEHGAYLLGEAVVSNDPTNLLLAGGHTPLPIYRSFVTKALDCSHTHIFQTDERITDDPQERNQTTMSEALARGKGLHCHWIDSTDVLGYAEQLLDRDIHLAMIGVGSDGHIASVFPETLKDLPSEHVFCSHTTQFSPHQRVTVHPDVIMRAKKLVILLRGEEDGQIYQRLRTNACDGTLPIDLVAGHQDCIVLYFPEE